jgi:predicted RNase H-like nuclease (RuvC/YqgF family)
MPFSDYKWMEKRLAELKEKNASLTARVTELEEALEEIRNCTSEHGGAAKALKIISAALTQPAQEDTNG